MYPSVNRAVFHPFLTTSRTSFAAGKPPVPAIVLVADPAKFPENDREEYRDRAVPNHAHGDRWECRKPGMVHILFLRGYHWALDANVDNRPLPFFIRASEALRKRPMHIAFELVSSLWFCYFALCTMRSMCGPKIPRSLTIGVCMYGWGRLQLENWEKSVPVPILLDRKR